MSDGQRGKNRTAQVDARVELRITMTGKSYSPQDSWRMIDRPETVRFESMAEARDYLRKRYGKAKRSPMFVDREGGGPPVKVGYVIGFRAADWSHSPVDKWLQQDWIEFRQSSAIQLGTHR